MRIGVYLLAPVLFGLRCGKRMRRSTNARERSVLNQVEEQAERADRLKAGKSERQIC